VESFHTEDVGECLVEECPEKEFGAQKYPQTFPCVNPPSKKGVHKTPNILEESLKKPPFLWVLPPPFSGGEEK